MQAKAIAYVTSGVHIAQFQFLHDVDLTVVILLDTVSLKEASAYPNTIHKTNTQMDKYVEICLPYHNCTINFPCKAVYVPVLKNCQHKSLQIKIAWNR